MKRGYGFGPWLPWTVWLVYAVAWTVALLTPEPVQVADAVFGEHRAFLAAKVLHVGAYALFTILSSRLHERRPFRWLVPAFLALHALGTEFFQGFVPLRSPAWRDVGLDYLGILLGLLLGWKWWREWP